MEEEAEIEGTVAGMEDTIKVERGLLRKATKGNKRRKKGNKREEKKEAKAKQKENKEVARQAKKAARKAEIEANTESSKAEKEAQKKALTKLGLKKMPSKSSMEKLECVQEKISELLVRCAKNILSKTN